MHLDLDLNQIHAHLREAQGAELRGDHQRRDVEALRGLAISCATLTELLANEGFKSVAATPEGKGILDGLLDAGRFVEFLEEEKRLLLMTKLDPSTVDHLLENAEGLARNATSADILAFKSRVLDVQRTVCDAVPRKQQGQTAILWLKRGFYCIGGCMIMLMNTYPPVPLSGVVMTSSVAFGGAIIGKGLG